jgi:hypothetical protein
MAARDWEVVMAHYKLNYLDTHGRVVARFEFQCSSDAEAELACEDLADARAKELWCGHRWIRAWAEPLRMLRRA